MSWAMKRRVIIIAIVSVVIALILAAIIVPLFVKAPTCFDNKQNGKETGIDCGGTCSRVCTAAVAPAQVRFVRAITTVGRTDVIAYIDNPNANAELLNAHFTVQLYGPDHVVVAQKDGIVNLPPSSTVPVFMPGFFSGFQTVAQAFLTFDDSSIVWTKPVGTRVVPVVVSTHVDAAPLPRITATLSNPSATPMDAVSVIVTVFDSTNNAIAASRTIIPTIPAQGTADALFTWNAPFSGDIARIEAVPIVVPTP